jgi:hypothetical protein
MTTDVEAVSGQVFSLTQVKVSTGVKSSNYPLLNNCILWYLLVT